jgi:hypothetical protein
MTSLTQRDYDEFLKLRIPHNILDRARISRVERLIAEEDYGIRLHGNGGILFSHFLPPLTDNDTKHPAAYTIRDDNPHYDAAGKPERKYVSAPGRQYPYTVPVDPSWYQDPSVPVILVEAAKSALSLLRWSEDNRRRLIPVGIAGCYGWRGVTGIEPGENGDRTEIKGLNPILASICRGHRVYILLDQNAATNDHVQRGRAWLADTLLEDKITTDVRILSLPRALTAPFWNGPDDFIAFQGDEVFHELFETAKRCQSSTWQSAFHKICELAAGESEPIIEGYFEEGLSFLGAKAGVCKTWQGISEGKALRTGDPFLGVFPVPHRRAVLYLIPEMTERRFRNRCEKLGVDINDPEFLVRTMNDGAPLPLGDPLVRSCVESLRPVIYLDTAVRFGGGKEENSAGEVSQGLINATYQLIQLGSPAVRALHHRAKDASDDDLTLENVLRGSGDFGASAVCVWGVAHETALRAGRLAQFDTQGRRKPDNAAKQKFEREYLQESKRLGRCYVECVKPGDRDLLLWNFRIQLRPSIDENGQIEMLTALPLVTSIDHGQVIDELLTAKPDSSAESLAKALNVSRATAYRRATDSGWTFDGEKRVWTR